MNRQNNFRLVSDILSNGCAFLDIDISDIIVSKLLIYFDLLQYWNSKFNLTSIIDPRKIAVYHFLDSITVFKIWPINSNAKFLDLGSGAGFPGLILKIVDPSLSMTLVDKNPKKIVFLKLVARELDIHNISYFNIGFKEFFEAHSFSKFDVVLFRALPKKALKLLDIRKVLNPSGSVIRMYSRLPEFQDSFLKNYDEVAIWRGKLPHFKLKRIVVRYQSSAL
ncbi:MAG: 16S rRNA (guanine(527)-N(7))-methyltransferase RsmG [Desulfomonilaceae bacterium]